MTTMEFRQFEMTLISAKDLLNVRQISDMRVYAKVSIKGVPDTEVQTSIDKKGSTNPCWNSKMVFYIDEATIHKEDIVLSIKLYCNRTFKSDKYVGEVNISLKKLSDHFGTSHERLGFTVDREGCEGTFGTLDVSYALGDPFMVEVGEDSTTGKVEFKTNEGSIGHNLLEFAKHIVVHGAIHIVIHEATHIDYEGVIDGATQMVTEYATQMATEGVMEGAAEIVMEGVMEGAAHIVMEGAAHIAMEGAVHIVMEGAAHIAMESAAHIAMEVAAHIAVEAAPVIAGIVLIALL